MTTCNKLGHDQRFRQVYGCINGCMACELEATKSQLAAVESQLVWLATWIEKRTGVHPNECIGTDGWPSTVAEVIAKMIEDRQFIVPNSDVEEVLPALVLAIRGRCYEVTL